MSRGTRFTEIRRFGELDSTNRYLLDEARGGAGEGLVVTADHQTAGRGRLGRRWEAPAGSNLLVSVLLRPDLRVEELHLCTLSMALAARSACVEAAGVEAVLKWPNDLVVGERKLAGILAETTTGAGRSEAPGAGSPPRAVVVGLGLNVGWPGPESDPGAVAVPEDLLDRATSLRRESGTRIEPSDLLGVVLGHLENRLDDLASAEGRGRLVAEYRRVCTTLGRDVMVSLAGEMVRGTVADISVEGHLLLDVGAGIRTVTAGDVVHLRT